MSTCVPQVMYLDLFDIHFSHSMEWQEAVTSVNDPNYKLRSIITARAKMRDLITVFQMDGIYSTFEEIAEVMVKPLPRGRVGGAHRATMADGIGYSGMSSRDVPEKGLMQGEPGTLLYIDPESDDWRSKRKHPFLCLETYVDDVEFISFIKLLSTTSAPLEGGLMRVLIELFEYEVDAFLSDGSHRRDYGMLMRNEGNKWAVTRARLECMQVVFCPITAQNQ